LSALRDAADSFHACRTRPLAYLASRMHDNPNFSLDRGRPGHGHHRSVARIPRSESPDLAAHSTRRSRIWLACIGFTSLYVVLHCVQLSDRGKRHLAHHELEDRKAVHGQLTTVTAAVFATVVVANLLSVIAEAGLHWNLPPEPSGYLLLK
jgi:hypothetical protein